MLEMLVSVWMEKGISLLSQKRGAIVVILAFYFLRRRLAIAIWATLSMQPQPVSD